MAAARGGDIAALVAILAPDVVLVTDGGGIRAAALRPIHGADKVLRWLGAVMGKPESAGMEFALRRVNGELAVVASNAGVLDGVIFVTVQDDQITALHGIRNPEKLGAL
jgi:RNA polymerase sigma-70 factor (ECF subfamily)